MTSRHQLPDANPRLTGCESLEPDEITDPVYPRRGREKHCSRKEKGRDRERDRTEDRIPRRRRKKETNKG